MTTNTWEKSLLLIYNQLGIAQVQFIIEDSADENGDHFILKSVHYNGYSSPSQWHARYSKSYSLVKQNLNKLSGPISIKELEVLHKYYRRFSLLRTEFVKIPVVSFDNRIKAIVLRNDLKINDVTTINRNFASFLLNPLGSDVEKDWIEQLDYLSQFIEIQLQFIDDTLQLIGKCLTRLFLNIHNEEKKKDSAGKFEGVMAEVLNVEQFSILIYYLKHFKAILPHSNNKLGELIHELAGHSEQNSRADHGLGNITQIELKKGAENSKALITFLEKITEKLRENLNKKI